MLGYFVLSVLAAWGLLCLGWFTAGALLCCRRRCVMVYLCRPGKAGMPLPCHRWLHAMGLLQGPLIVAGSTLPPEEQKKLTARREHIVFCSLAELPARLELERNKLD